MVVPSVALEAQVQTTAEIRALAHEAILAQPLLTRPSYLPRISKDVQIPSLTEQSPMNGAEGRQGAPG